MYSRTAADIPSALWKQYRPFKSVAEEGSPVTAESAKAVASAIASQLKGRFGATKVVLFGSLARDDVDRWSDIDLAVWGISPCNYYCAVAFATGFDHSFKVDLVDAEDCSESLRKLLETEGIDL
ncbi:MAG: hypothetical protein A2075_00895 [Geobacteraceae bacterium GWC2_58_44]|nr:MAG: hypothetical protein A2075_00895 [Geobacteraceae bacterium GWC2_58_44]HBG04867.1 nucleotidyltransferase domain-containing protein [Geobacter sp.]